MDEGSRIPDSHTPSAHCRRQAPAAGLGDANTMTAFKTRQVRPLWIVTAMVVLLLGGYATHVLVASPLTVSGGQIQPTVGSVRLPDGGYELRYVPNGEVALIVQLTNKGRFGVRLTGIDLPWVSEDPWAIPSALQYSRRVLVGPEGAERPLEPVTVEPGQTVTLGWHLVMCPPPGWPPATSPKPVSEFVVRYRYAGWQRGHTETLPQQLVLPGNVCP
jgi:hypothetical protein